MTRFKDGIRNLRKPALSMQRISLAELAMPIPDISPDIRVERVAKLLLDPCYDEALSIPVVDNGLPVGIVSRYRFMEIYLKPYGRDLFGRETIDRMMHREPLVVDAKSSIEEAARYISNNLESPVKDDFIIVNDGKYFGTVAVMSLLKALEDRIASRNELLQKAYGQLKASQAQLVQSEKMASLGQMVAGVAHEINTPLGYVRNNVEVSRGIIEQTGLLVGRCRDLLNDMVSEEQDKATLDLKILSLAQEIEIFEQDGVFAEIKNLADDSLYGLGQISEIVSNLKDFSRLDRAKVSDIDVHQCIDSALVIGKNAIKYKAEVVKQYGDLPRIHCSPSQLNQVFLNMLTNAAQAIGESGKIYIRTWTEADDIYISIRDTGTGIAKDKLGKIFDPFYTTKPVGEGTGLGLSISYQIIKQHRGGIRVRSKEGVGTEFIIRLPGREGAAPGADVQLKKVVDF